MSDINAAPSSTEPAAAGDNVNATEVQTRAQEAGTATLGESPAGSLNAGTVLTPTASTGDAGSVQSASLTPIDTSTLGNDGTTNGLDAGATAANTTSTTDTTSGTTDAPAVAAPGEASATSDANASAPESSQRQQVSSAADALQAGEADAGNAGVSPAAGQSASDTASCAQDASQGGDTAADALRAELGAAHVRIAALEQQLNAATAAKPHATSLLQKLEAGEAIVLGDLQSRLRAFVDAL
ncbi:hypothetical protein SY91_01758 [Burkholderia cenocepacia]|uniref:hypothetical protein n=1 Tax=Burkholderia cenocepacia TaxID=95486 RepID=UPI00163BA9B1|nr:hypothetical protein [Burkholderia cenocepacia]QND94359.1 hypothetical protein SY91_01758 [Burkholderia cenocepacia]